MEGQIGASSKKNSATITSSVEGAKAQASEVVTNGGGAQGEGGTVSNKDSTAVSATFVAGDIDAVVGPSSSKGESVQGGDGIRCDEHHATADIIARIGVDGEAIGQVRGINEEAVGRAGDRELTASEGDGSAI